MTRLDEIWERDEKATPGPWETSGKAVRQELKADHSFVPSARYGGICNCLGGNSYQSRPSDPINKQARLNANFIAHARADIPFLLGEVTRLQDELQYASDGVKVLAKEGARLAAERDAAISDMGQLANEHGSCFGCKWANSDYLHCDKPDDRMVRGEKCWEWRGVEGREDA